MQSISLLIHSESFNQVDICSTVLRVYSQRYCLIDISFKKLFNLPLMPLSKFNDTKHFAVVDATAQHVTGSMARNA